MQRKALITGVTGQDGYYLTRLLLGKGYRVYGLVRRSARDTECQHVPHGVEIINGDVTDPGIVGQLARIEADEIYNLAAMSHVGESFTQPATAMQTNAIGTLHMLEVARETGARVYQASTSELFGNQPAPQNELTPFQPRSPYACAKAAAFHLVAMYRDAYGLHASNGILFNHESPRRGADFVTQKVCRAVAAIAAGEQDVLELGNLQALRDWGHAEDYVRGMWQMVQHDTPDDYVLATGISRSVETLCEVAFRAAGIQDWRAYVVDNPDLHRPLDVQDLCGDATKAREVLGWRPRWSFEQMIGDMVHAAAIPARAQHVG
jgi:GDPmannose 4,6-dehydratase